MWRNYLTVGIRALTKNGTYAFITIFGLALGLAACLTILLYVRYELSYDRWIPGADRAYQLQDFYRAAPMGMEEMKLQSTSFVSRKALVKDFPQIEDSVFMHSIGAVLMQNGEANAVEDFALVDANLFNIIRLPFVAGDARHALDHPGDIVLTESEAGKRLPHQDPIGKTLTFNMGQQGMVDYRVTGVIRDLPKNSHLKLGMIARYDPNTFYATMPQFMTNWDWEAGHAYVKLRPGASAEAINAQLPAWEKRNIPNEIAAGVVHNPGTNQDWQLANIRDVHLGEAQITDMTPGSDRRTVVTFALIAVLILAMAVVNFVNLATARASQRAREVALRKVLGASRRQLIVQFIGESILITALAMLLGLAIAELLLPYVNAFLDSDMDIHYFGGGGLLLPILLIVLIVGAAGGIYPALYLSRFQPAEVLKANQSTSEAHGSGRLRNLLVIAPFAVSIGLIICTAVIYAQTIYARTADAGYRRDGLLQVKSIEMSMKATQLEALRQAAERVPGVQKASLTQINVNPGTNSMTQLLLPGSTEPVMLGNYGVDDHFFDAMGMKLLAGRQFSDKIALDDATLPVESDPAAERALAERGGNVIVTELAAKNLGFASPEAAIGKHMDVLMQSEGMKMPLTIVGVVWDARFRSMRVPLQPIMYHYQRNDFYAMMVRYDSARPAEVMASLEKMWRRIVPTIPFRAEFVDDSLRKMYKADEARGQMFGVFAMLAVVIGCLGLFGLAAFTAERRTKEIGIRKVLGARTSDIVRLLAWQFSRPVIIANLIAWPVAWWVMRDWLNGFDTRIALSPTYFVLAGALALIIAIGTIAAHAIKVARANPIHALRYE
jgi:putative ABC transport system permease protein